MSVRTRFAPSPTGYLHVGGARTALYNYLYAKKMGGTFVLRVEDTDQERSTEESMRSQLSDLSWLGLDWQEGIQAETLEEKGKYGPYRQSQRLEIYKKHADKLIEKGLAYYCFYSSEELEQKKAEAQEKGWPQIRNDYRDRSLEEAKKRIAEGDKPVVRFKVPLERREYLHKDIVRGDVTFNSEMVGDFVILRSDGMPVYNFCCAIDDALMKITHVLRAEEHLSNTLRQMMIYEAFGWELPEFGHLSIMLGPDKQKLSKRHGATSCNEYREGGYLAEALNNFIALCGWSHPEGKEVFDMADLLENFSLERFNAASAVFDETKLKWVNASHLRSLPHQELWQAIQPFVSELSLPTNSGWQNKALEILKPKMETLADAKDLFAPFSGYELSEAASDVLSWESSRAVITAWIDEIKGVSGEISEEQFSEIQNAVKAAAGVKGKFLFMPLRVCVTGAPQGADLAKTVPLLSVEELVGRAEKALAAVQ